MKLVVIEPGTRFDRAVVLRREGAAPKNGDALYRCKCDCGAEFVARSYMLRRGDTGSCGCKRRDTTRQSAKRRRRSDPKAVASRYLFNTYRRSAQQRGYVFALEEAAFVSLCESPCHYCGALPAREHRPYLTKGKAHNAHMQDWADKVLFVYNGLDRVDNTLGYLPGNVVACCTQCNGAKLNYTQEEFLFWANQLYSHQNRGPKEEKHVLWI